MRFVIAMCLLLLCACGGATVARFTTEDNVHIAYTFQKGEAGKPAILLLHMLGRTRADWNAFARQLNQQGYPTLAIDLRGHGQSEGRLSTDNDYRAMVKDVAGAKRFLAEQNISNVVIIGASIGANTALNYAVSDSDVKAAVLLSPGIDYHGVNVNASMKTVKVPLLIAASKEDSYAYNSSKTIANITGAKFIGYDKAGHGTAMFSTTNLSQAIIDWLGQTVSTD
jgi:alpha-beta hydrolase superfamily lysophospholipase